MNSLPHRWCLQLTRVALTHVVAPAWILLSCVLGVQAQNSVTSGLTRPGWPNDQPGEAGGIRFVADDPGARKQAVGGTIYSEVLKRTRDGDDPWGTGLEKFTATFQPGLDFNGVSSPSLDIRAEYLYLYQVVNDRRTDAPIESVAIKLQVEMKDITSWGYFDGIGFGAMARGEDRGESVRPVSFGNILGADDGKAVYKSPAPIEQQSLLKLTRIPTRQNPLQPKSDVGSVARIIWDALDPANNPDYVMMLSNSDFESAPSVRAIWSGSNILKRSSRSTVFGFTSNLPPVVDAVRLRTTKEASKEAANVRFAGTEPSAELEAKEGVVKDGIVGAVGKVPTPRPEAAEVAAGAAPPLQTGLPQQGGSPNGGAPMGGFGGGGFPAVGGGGLGGARPPNSGGGGIAGTEGTDQSGQQGQDHQAKINFNANLTNEQNNNGCCNSCDNDNGGGNVIPEPATLLGASLGLPVVFYLWRRRGRQALQA